MARTWGDVLSEHGYLDDREAEAVDNPGGKMDRRLGADRHEAAAAVGQMLLGARRMQGDGDEGEQGASFASVQRERAVNSARMVADSSDSASELETAAKDLHAMLGSSLSEAEKEAVNALRNAEYEKRTGNSADVFDGVGVPESMDLRVRTDPRPTAFERDRTDAENRLRNRARRLRNQHEHGDGSFEKQSEAQRIDGMADEVSKAETTDELRTAQGMLTQDARDEFLRDAAEVAKKTNPGNKEYDAEFAERVEQ